MDCCENCFHWKRSEFDLNAGECRESPPQIVTILVPVQGSPQMQQGVKGYFPVTASDISCGKHKPKVDNSK